MSEIVDVKQFNIARVDSDVVREVDFVIGGGSIDIAEIESLPLEIMETTILIESDTR